MTWTVTARGFDTQSASSADLTSDTFTPAANVLLMAIIIQNEGDGTVNGITGHGTWSRISFGDAQGPTVNEDYELWACNTGGSPSSATITIDVDYQNQVSVIFIEVDETLGFDATLANNFGTPAYDNGFGTGVTYTATVAAFANSDNLALGICGARGGSAGTQWTAEGGYTEMTEQQGNSVNMLIIYQGSEDITISATCDEASVNASIMGIEIKHAAAAPSGIEIFRRRIEGY